MRLTSSPLLFVTLLASISGGLLVAGIVVAALLPTAAVIITHYLDPDPA